MLKRLKRLFSTEEIVRWEPRGEDIKVTAPWYSDRHKRVSDLEEATELMPDDCLLLTHESGEIRKSMKVKLSTLRKFIKS